MDDDNKSTKLTGVVVISLPPPDNPSLGKTITAYTVSDLDSDPSPSQVLARQEHDFNGQSDQSHQLPVAANPLDHQLQFSFRNLFLGLPEKLLGFLGISLFALFLYGAVSSSTFQQLRSSKNDDKANSVIFPLYHKLNVRRQSDLELKLGRLVNEENNDFENPQVSDFNKLVASTDVSVDSSSILPVRGNIDPDGLYFTEVHVGIPPKRYFLDIDTGSDLTWIQCDAPCTSCAKGAHSLYKPRKENVVPNRDTFCKEMHKNQKVFSSENQCDYEIQYADHSSSMGVLLQDKLHLMITNGSETKLNFVFGCAYDQQGILLNTLVKTDGILGLSRAKVSLPSQLASQGVINNVVGQCISNRVSDDGHMFLGEDFVPYWGMTWVPMSESLSTDFYQTEIVGINYGNSPFSFDGKSSRSLHVIFDSGSLYTYFPKDAYTSLIASIKQLSDSGMELTQDPSDTTLPICWRFTSPIRYVKDIKHIVKDINLQFRRNWRIVSTKFRIPPEGYLIISPKGNVCLGILDGSNVHDGSSIVLGDISLRGQLIVYDNINQRIGWKQSHCTMPRMLTKPLEYLVDDML